MPTGRLAKWQILLTEFDIVYVTRTTMKAQALADHLAENPVDDEYQPLSTYFPDEEVNLVEAISEDTKAWKMFFDGAVNAKGIGLGAILISPIGQHYLATTRFRVFCTNNTAEYEACIMGMNMAIDQDVKELLIMGDLDLIIRQAQGEWETRDVKLIPYKQYVEDFSKLFKSIEFSIPTTIITDNAANLNSHLMREICEQFKIAHRTLPYHPKANGAVEATNKNIKKILRKMIQSSRQWHEKLPFALLGYRTMVRTSIGATPYLLVYGTEVVIPVEVEIPPLWIIVKAEIENTKWVKTRLEQLTLINEKRMVVVCHGQLYQQRMARAYNKKVRPRNFEVGQLVLRRILPHHQEAKGKICSQLERSIHYQKIIAKKALYLGDIEGNDPETAVNVDAVKRYYV
ncbi:uncharacterized protein [Nicotiana sylvestris]|uniref:uncharacterized protein n=1 Tax=Nicotiana sylvestris TaxID=4096 RepID=UPI00388C3A58